MVRVAGEPPPGAAPAVPALAYLDGEFLPLTEARVPALDRGFLFGDGVYEVIPAYDGRLFCLDRHLDRLARSLAAVRIEDPHGRAQWERLLGDLVARNGGGDLSVYLQVTRGVQSPRDHAFPRGLAPTVFAMAQPIVPVPAERLEQGLAAVTLEDIRWQACHVKAVTLLANVLLRQQAVERGAQEAILLREGQAVEGAASNLFVVSGGRLRTPPLGPWLLGGITRDLVLALAARDGIPAQEAPVDLGTLQGAEEVWLTSSTKEVLPVTRIDGRPVGAGLPGPLWRRMRALYQECKRRGGPPCGPAGR